MITLFQFRPLWGLPNLSPFCMKVETYLRMTQIPYQTRLTLPNRAPKSHLPFIRNEETGETISDSTLILRYLSDRFRPTLDASISPDDRAIGLAFEKLLEDHLYFVGCYVRWIYPPGWQVSKLGYFGKLKGLKRHYFPPIARRMMRNRLLEQGMGFNSEDEVFSLGRQSLSAVSQFLGNKPYFLGLSPSSTDATALAFLSSLVLAPVKSPLTEHCLKIPNLEAYCRRLLKQYFPEYSANLPTDA